MQQLERFANRAARDRERIGDLPLGRQPPAVFVSPAGDGFALAWNEYVAPADGKAATSQIAFTIVR